MQLYKGPFLNITFEKKNDLFLQFWETSPISISDFKKEMLIYTSWYKKLNPRNTLWLQKNFTFDLDSTTNEWIERMVNIPCKKYGNKKCAFVVSSDILVHLSVINAFDKVESCIIPEHFIDEAQARTWLSSSKLKTENSSKTKIIYEGLDENGNAIIKITNPSKNIKKTIKYFGDTFEKDDFIKNNSHDFSQLTKREKEIFKLVAQGKKQLDIANQLYISKHTVRTHWRNIKVKLNIISNIDIVTYYKAFLE